MPTVLLTASAAGSSAVTAAVVRTRLIKHAAPWVSSSSTVTATVVRTRSLTAAVASSSTVTATIVRTRTLVPGVSSSSAVTATVVRTRSFTAAAAGSSIAAATVTRTRGLVATATGQSTIAVAVAVIPAPPKTGGGNGSAGNRYKADVMALGREWLRQRARGRYIEEEEPVSATPAARAPDRSVSVEEELEELVALGLM